jgi:hypothetical protein
MSGTGGKEIVATIDENGDITIAVRGAKGKECLKLTEQIEKLLGGKVVERTLKREYYDRAQVDGSVKAGR